MVLQLYLEAPDVLARLVLSDFFRNDNPESALAVSAPDQRTVISEQSDRIFLSGRDDSIESDFRRHFRLVFVSDVECIHISVLGREAYLPVLADGIWLCSVDAFRVDLHPVSYLAKTLVCRIFEGSVRARSHVEKQVSSS